MFLREETLSIELVFMCLLVPEDMIELQAEFSWDDFTRSVGRDELETETVCL